MRKKSTMLRLSAQDIVNEIEENKKKAEAEKAKKLDKRSVDYLNTVLIPELHKQLCFEMGHIGDEKAFNEGLKKLVEREYTYTGQSYMHIGVELDRKDFKDKHIDTMHKAIKVECEKWSKLSGMFLSYIDFKTYNIDICFLYEEQKNEMEIKEEENDDNHNHISEDFYETAELYGTANL